MKNPEDDEWKNELKLLDHYENHIIENYKLSIVKASRSYFIFLVVAALFLLIANGNTGELKLFGSSIEEPKSFLWVLLMIGAFNYMVSMLAFSASEQMWQALFSLDLSRTINDWPNAKPSKAFTLITPPSILSLPFINIIPAGSKKEENKDEGFAVWLVVLYVLFPLIFFAWSAYTIISNNQDSFIALLAVIISCILVWAGMTMVWRSLRGNARNNTE